MKYYVLAGLIFMGISCQSGNAHREKDRAKSNGAGKVEGDSSSDGNEGSIAASHFTPPPSASYQYTITNESETEVEANGKTVTNKHKSDVAITYNIQKDSAGNYLLGLHYDKIHLYAKSGENESELDAASAANSMNPVEKMLGVLKDAKIVATVSSSGKVIAINGYKELGEKILGSFKADATSYNMAKSQWEKVIGEGMVKKSIEQMFSILPDSDVQVGDTWKKSTKQAGEFNMTATSTFKLKDLEDGIASIESEGELKSDKGETQVMGYAVTSNLQGDQQGEYEVETKTGMVLKNKTTSKLKGSMQLMGKDIPVTVKTTLTMNGRKVK